MTPNIAAAVYAIFSIAMPFALVVRLRPLPFLVRCFAAWTIAVLLLFFLDDPLFILLLAGLMLLLLAPLAPIERICFFFVTVPYLPFYIEAFLPFPGINWLVLLTHYKIVVLVLLFPLLCPTKLDDGRQGRISLADICLVLYVAISVALVTASGGATAGPRFLIDQFLVLIVPFFVLSRAVQNEKDLESCFRAIFIVCLILASITLVSTLKQWDFYRMKAPPSVFTIPDLRSGFLRIETTANTHSLGFHLAIGVLVLEYVKRQFSWGFMRVWAMRGMLVAALYFTDSRGAMLALAVALVIYAAVIPTSKALRRTLMAVLLAAGTFGFIFFVSGDVSSVDKHGSFNYRQQLLTISMAHILEYPLLGDLNFAADPKFAPLVQGQGIVDVTNFYLQVGLQYGLVGLALFLTIVFVVLRGLLRTIDQLAATDSDAARSLRVMSAILLALIFGWLVLIATTSDVALTIHVGLILLGLGRAVPAMAPLSASQSSSQIALEPANTRFAFPNGPR